MSPNAPSHGDESPTNSTLRRTPSNITAIFVGRSPSRGRSLTRRPPSPSTPDHFPAQSRRETVRERRRRDLEEHANQTQRSLHAPTDRRSVRALRLQLRELDFVAPPATTRESGSNERRLHRLSTAAHSNYSTSSDPAESSRSTRRSTRRSDSRRPGSSPTLPDLSTLRGASEHSSRPTVMASSNAFPTLDTSVPAAGNRSAGTSPTTGPSANGNNGINGPSAASTAAYMPPLPVGHQQDLNHLYNQIQELGNLLRSNREKVNSITKNAEEVARRANGALADGESTGPADNDKARIRELELELSKQKHLVELYKHEQKENTGLIAMYEEALGTATEQIRNYCGGIEARFLGQRKHYNNLLQQEKDDHLVSRLDRDHWYAQTLKVCEMIRTAHRLRSDEWAEEYTIVSALQGEVRILRRVFGMEKQEPEEETGWPYLKDLPLPE